MSQNRAAQISTSWQKLKPITFSSNRSQSTSTPYHLPDHIMHDSSNRLPNPAQPPKCNLRCWPAEKSSIFTLARSIWKLSPWEYIYLSFSSQPLPEMLAISSAAAAAVFFRTYPQIQTHTHTDRLSDEWLRSMLVQLYFTTDLHPPTIQNDPVSLSDGSTPSGALCHRFGCCSSLEPPTTTRTIRRKLFCCLGFGLHLRRRRWLEPSSKASFLLHSPFWKQLNYTQLINGGVPGASGWFVSTWTHLALGCRFFFCFLFASSSISAGNVLHEQIKKTFSAQHDKWICLKI